MMEYVILGNGIAGVCAAETIRGLDSEGSIRMVADEPVTPYSRPMISMVLAGEVSEDKLPIRNRTFFKDLNIKPVLGNRVTGIDVDKKEVMVQNGASLAFDKLLIATGADPRPIKAEGMDRKNIFYMRTQAHVQEMLKVLPDVRKALVLGGGLVGFKAAYALMQRGLEVSMLITSGYPLSMQVDEAAGGMIRKELEKFGLNVTVGMSVVAFEGEGAVTGAILSDGTHASCDLVVVGKGVRPACSFVPGDQIDKDLGIVVNEYMETSVRDVFAAGDVAESMDISRQEPWINAIWPEAVAQGRVAGANMAGRQVPYKGSLSRNVMRIFDLDLMTMGLVNPPPDSEFEVITAHDQRRKTYRKLVFRQDILVGAVLINNIDQGGIFMGLIHNEVPLHIPKSLLAEPTFNFKQLVI
ncbi:MAG: FAD-dependent oxidoreductase [Desulfatiglans sp.]|jgi:NAD(P)H-nitrite reductase large subunit|nr:FAD-dependent oxidoreductase [Desulfatiglans sp.]